MLDTSQIFKVLRNLPRKWFLFTASFGPSGLIGRKVPKISFLGIWARYGCKFEWRLLVDNKDYEFFLTKSKDRVLLSSQNPNGAHDGSSGVLSSLIYRHYSQFTTSLSQETDKWDSNVLSNVQENDLKEKLHKVNISSFLLYFRLIC